MCSKCDLFLVYLDNTTCLVMGIFCYGPWCCVVNVWCICIILLVDGYMTHGVVQCFSSITTNRNFSSLLGFKFKSFENKFID